MTVRMTITHGDNDDRRPTTQVSNSVRLTLANPSGSIGEALGSPYPYFGLVATVILAVSNVLMLNKAVEGAPATFSIPLYQSLNVICAILAGGLFFGELDTLQT